MHKKRLKKLQEKVRESGCDAYLVEDQINLFYLTGINMSAGRLIVKPDESRLYVDGRYFELCKARAPLPTFPLEEYSLDGIKTLGFNKQKTTYARYEKLNAKEAVGLNDLVAELRLIKDEEEIQLLREAAELGSQGYDYICTLLKEGISEAAIAIELEIFWKRLGGKAAAFDPIIAFGSNSSMPHYRAQECTLKKGDIVLFDIGVTRKHYHSDMTRVQFFGKVHPELQKIYEIVRSAQLAALELCCPGTRIADLDGAARDLIAEAGYGDRFTHSLGHGIGLEVHEDPILRNNDPYKDMVLKAGMAITIEPGIYLPGIGGVRLEDTVLITPDGHENLTKRPV